MADLDLQKKKEEAAQQRSSIAEALLNIQQSLDLIAPSVAKMEPTLTALEPVVQDLSAWRPGVDAAVGRLQTDLGDIRAQLAKMAMGVEARSKAIDPSTSATADALGLEGNLSGDGHGQTGHRSSLTTRELAGGGGGGHSFPLRSQAMGLLDDQFRQLEMLQDESNPDFVAKVVMLLCEEGEHIIGELAKQLDQPCVDYGKVDTFVDQLRGNSACVGAQRVKNTCIQFHVCCQEKSKVGCLKTLDSLRNDFYDLCSMFIP